MPQINERAILAVLGEVAEDPLKLPMVLAEKILVLRPVPGLRVELGVT